MRVATSALVLFLVGLPAFAQEQALGTRMSAGHGSYIVDGEGRTLYLFEEDRRGTADRPAESRCTDACASAWPPVIAQPPPEAPEGASQDLVGTTERPDGDTQVTYGGWPLYRHVGDAGPGMATGAMFQKPQFGGRWRLVSPAGEPAQQAAGAENPFAGLAFKEARMRPARPRGRPLPGLERQRPVHREGQQRLHQPHRAGRRLGPKVDRGRQGWRVRLNAPKGMELSGGRLYVADVDHVRIIHSGTGKPLDAIEVPGAQFLNGIAVAEDGTIYASDTGTMDVHGASLRT